ncbi:beta family protein [Sedimenticola selenatireducens]|uniref:beta family protein n=1 Tax=Sedimenticola selenatireducens TaxID=191960 RepID=UPI002AAB745A|nr:beta family protein [Sedimenticola selenatireducens]
MEYIRPTYVPIIKSTDAELKGYSYLGEDVKAATTPVFELTRSRRSKNAPDGNIHRRMEQISEIVKDIPFILDLTAHEDLSNDQIDDLLDETGGFQNWIEFLGEYPDLNIVPAIHFYEDTHESVIKQEVQQLLSNHTKLALRVQPDDSSINDYLEIIRSVLTSDDQLILVFDADYIIEEEYQKILEQIVERYQDLPVGFEPWSIVVCASSFPASVVQLSGCYDDHGTIPLLEKKLHLDLKGKGYWICYGDYASVHPKRYQARGGTWVPRVDISLNDSIIYTRYRRQAGGYVRAAKEMIAHPRYSSFDCWGHEQVRQAAEGNPGGLSPSFWIAVRMNIHMSKHYIAT